MMPGPELATRLHRWSVNAALVTGLAVLPTYVSAQAAVPDDSTGDVFVSRRELRVVFPAQSAVAWKWVTSTEPENAPAFFWHAFFHGVQGRVRLAVDLDARDGTRVAPSLESVVRAAKVERCQQSDHGRCIEEGVKASVQGRRVTITLQDSALIARLFALRPDSISIFSSVPRYLGATRWSFARVHYIVPQLATLDSAAYARALASQREYDLRVLELSRSLSGGNDNALLWLAVGDSAELGIEEWECKGDLCGQYTGYRGSPQYWGRWSVDDPRIARVHRSPASHRDFRFAFHRDQVMTIVGLRPGRTKVRTAGVHTLADSVASISPLDSILERDVIVTPPIGRFRITPRPATMVAGDSAWFAVEVLDRRGRSVRGAPVDLLWGVVGSYSVSSAPNPVRVIFDKPGLYRFVATLGTHADTLHVDVRPAAAAP